MTNTTCTELYQELMQSVSDLLCDVCVIEALYRCRLSLSGFAMRPALGEELRRTRDFLEQHARDTETAGRHLLDCLAADAGMKKEPSQNGSF